MLVRILGLSAVLWASVSCNESHSGGPTVSHIKASAILEDSHLSAPERAERLAKAAEQLLTVQGFAFAAEVVELALAQDPTNLRAGFVKAILAPLMAQQGILTRIAPLAKTDPELEKEYFNSLSKIETERPNSTLKTFLLDGKPDISSESDLQTYFDSVAEGFSVLRNFAKSHKDEPLTMMASDVLRDFVQKRYFEACTVVRNDPREWDFEIKCPSPVNMWEITFNRADFEGVQQLAAGLELYSSLANSYDLAGSVQLAIDQWKNDQRKDGRKVSAQEILNKLFDDPQFGVLRKQNGFAKIKDMGVDALVGMRWIMNHQDSLCPLGSPNPRNRIGALFQEGICVRDLVETAAALRKAEEALAGKDVLIDIPRSETSYRTRIRPMSLVESPIADLRNLNPISVSDGGQVCSVGDSTFGGLFPLQDANTILSLNESCQH